MNRDLTVCPDTCIVFHSFFLPFLDTRHSSSSFSSLSSPFLLHNVLHAFLRPVLPLPSFFPSTFCFIIFVSFFLPFGSFAFPAFPPPVLFLVAHFPFALLPYAKESRWISTTKLVDAF